MNLPLKCGILVVAISFLSLGCASIKHNSVTENNDATAEGIRYYNSSPYLLVYSNGKGGIITQIIYIADPHKKMAAKPTGFLSSAQATLEFDKGVMKSSKSILDASSLPVAVMKAIQTVGVAALTPAGNDPQGTKRQIPAPYLYKIFVKGSTISFVGGQGNVSVDVDLLKQEEPASKEGKEAAEKKEESPKPRKESPAKKEK